MREYFVIIFSAIMASGAATVMYGLLTSHQDDMTRTVVCVFFGFLAYQYIRGRK